MTRFPHRVVLHKDLPVPMPDGVVLLADRYIPIGVSAPPAILIRSPYGRRGLFGLAYGRAFARHGFQVILQSCRGGFGSGGELTPLDEQDDGLATVEWMRAQPWYGGSFAMHGPSYLGYAQWAIAPHAGPDLKAMATQVTASQFRDAAYVGGSFALEATLSWSTLTAMMSGPLAGAAVLFAPRRTQRAVMSGRPVGEFDLLAAGRTLPFFQEVLTHHADPAVPFWKKRDFSATVGEVDAAVTMTGGWYDVFLPWQLKDYAAMRAAGRRPHLTIGPWHHADVRHGRLANLDALHWFRAHLLGDASGLRASPVRLYVTGAGMWRDYEDWPVPGMTRRRWHLQPGFGLGEAGPANSPPDRYRYHPARPTPVIGGPTLLGNSAPRDNRRLEARSDVLVYTGEALREDLDLIGPVTAEIYLRSSTPYTDLVVRVCDVHADGTSLNVCEGVRRLLPGVPPTDEEGVRRVDVDLWPIAHRFRRGHRVRVQVASGAYPRLARNLGTGEPLGTGSTAVPADQEVFHDPARPSALYLPHARA
ncbi:peptidase S15 [Sphaerisporangium siamense]|uniref:Putative CocE/NonD family hydrolase n=1 Tax=Sphaerisporangium siamense TaxID=795645 RepID=A0A7W7DBZ3_9ACTN|nr:CocE/NonD family hydrolase [Sphaerisporangium siamense]MBB4704024.1 putative CocE/NonD family hydrolase [Sphaerisporangium siamense]GII82498.1 peptidase S15 [Sphaerisporangium siamense]